MIAIQISHKEQRLQEIEKEIKKCEALINSPKVHNGKYKNGKIKELERLVKEKQRLVDEITQASFLEL